MEEKKRKENSISFTKGTETIIESIKKSPKNFPTYKKPVKKKKKKQNNSFVFSAVLISLVSGLTFAYPLIKESVQTKLNLSQTVVNNIYTLGIASCALVGFVFDYIVRFSLFWVIFLSGVFASISLVTMGLSFDNPAAYPLAQKLVFIGFYTFLNFFCGLSYLCALLIARKWVSEKKRSTMIGVLSCCYGLSVLFYTYLKALAKNDSKLFIFVTAAVYFTFSFFSAVFLKLSSLPPEKKEGTRLQREIQQGSVLFANASALVEEAFSRFEAAKDFSVTKNTIFMSARRDSVEKSALFSRIEQQHQEQQKPLTFFNELFSFHGFVAVSTVAVMVGIQKNIYNLIPELVRVVGESNQKLVRQVMLISLASALSRLSSGVLFDYLVSKKIIETTFPLICVYCLMVFSASVLSAISLKVGIAFYCLSLFFGLSGGVYALVPGLFAAIFTAQRFSAMLAVSEVTSVFCSLLFTNLPGIIISIIGNLEKGYKIYFGVSAGIIVVLIILNEIARRIF